METSIELHELAEVRLPLAPLPIRRPLALAAPQPAREHPAAQRLMVDRQPVFTGQMFRHQRRPEARRHVAAIFLPDERQHSLSRLDRRPAIGDPSRMPVAKRLRTIPFE